MSAAVTFNDIVLDDNNNYARSKKDDSPQTLTFSVTKSEWIPCPSPPSSLSSSSTASVSSIWNQLRLENLNKHNLWLIFASIFLPIGYPSSVTSDYGMFQICDTIQALCSYLRGLLTTRATLIGIGVGKQSANATSAIVQFIFRDLSGLVGNVLFSWKYSFSFGIEVKQWRLFADVINDLALTLELLSPFFASKFVFVCILCIASVCKAMCGVSAGATRIAIAKHFALKDNETDLVAKEGIQETFVTILGMLLGLLLTACLSDDGSVYESVVVISVFAVLTAIHVIANYYAVQSLQLNTFNRQRLRILIEHYLNTKEVLTPKQVCKFENVWFNVLNVIPCMKSKRNRLIHCRFGVRVNQISAPWMTWNLKRNSSGNELQMFYVDVTSKDDVFCVSVAYHVDAKDMDLIRSFLVATVVEQWLWKQIQQDGCSNSVVDGKPNAALSQLLPSDKEWQQFETSLTENRCWHIANLSWSLSVMKNRYSQC